MATELINLGDVIAQYGLDIDDVAKNLFPTNKYATQAVYRILRGDTELSSTQIGRLAQMCGVLVSDLFALTGRDWESIEGARAKAGYEDGHITLTIGNYKAIIGYNNQFMTLFKDGVVVDSVVTNTVDCMTLPQLIKLIKRCIVKTDKNGNGDHNHNQV